MFHNSLISLLFVYSRNSQSRWCICCADLLQHFSFTGGTDPGLPVPYSHSFPLLWECAVVHRESPAPYGSAYRKLTPCLHEIFSFQTTSSESTGGRSNLASIYTEQKEFEIPSIFRRIKANMCLSQNISLPHKYKHAVTVFRDTLSHIMVYAKGLT